MTTFQTTGTFDANDETFTISIAPNNNHLISLDGLSVEDMKNLKDLIDILLESFVDFKNSPEFEIKETTETITSGASKSPKNTDTQITCTEKCKCR